MDAFVARLRHTLPEGVHVSAGAAHLPAECPAAEQLLEVADRRLYSDKTAESRIGGTGAGLAAPVPPPEVGWSDGRCC